jgi:hypothetical protein
MKVRVGYRIEAQPHCMGGACVNLYGLTFFYKSFSGKWKDKTFCHSCNHEREATRPWEVGAACDVGAAFMGARGCALGHRPPMSRDTLRVFF